MRNVTLMVALVCLVLPAATFGQETGVTCDACTHVVPVFMGSGGLIAEVDSDDDDAMVTVFSRCGRVTNSRELVPANNGKVTLLFSVENGLACDDDDENNVLELGPVMDGGWFWITDDMNSAVGALIARSVLDNDHKVKPVNAGAGVTMHEGMGAWLVKETGTGRIGLLPEVLPVPDMMPDPVNVCSYTGKGTSTAPYAPEKSKCMLGDGGAKLQVNGPTNIFTGKRAVIGANGMVTRPASGSLNVAVDLWGNGTGHFVTTFDSADNGANAQLGHGPDGVPLAATLTASVGSTGPGAGNDIDADDSSDDAGMLFEVNNDTRVGVLTIEPHANWCNPRAKPPVSHPAIVTFTANLDADQKMQVTPTIKTQPAAVGTAARQSITVVCPKPSSSVHQGQELIPENPFPVDD